MWGGEGVLFRTGPRFQTLQVRGEGILVLRPRHGWDGIFHLEEVLHCVIPRLRLRLPLCPRELELRRRRAGRGRGPAHGDIWAWLRGTVRGRRCGGVSGVDFGKGGGEGGVDGIGGVGRRIGGRSGGDGGAGDRGCGCGDGGDGEFEAHLGGDFERSSWDRYGYRWLLGGGFFAEVVGFEEVAFGHGEW